MIQIFWSRYAPRVIILILTINKISFSLTVLFTYSCVLRQLLECGGKMLHRLFAVSSVLPIADPGSLALVPIKGSENLYVDSSSFCNNEGDAIQVIVEETNLGLVFRLPREAGSVLRNVPRSVKKAIRYWHASLVVEDPDFVDQNKIETMIHPKGHTGIKVTVSYDSVTFLIRAQWERKARFLTEQCLLNKVEYRLLYNRLEEFEAKASKTWSNNLAKDANQLCLALNRWTNGQTIYTKYFPELIQTPNGALIQTAYKHEELLLATVLYQGEPLTVMFGPRDFRTQFLNMVLCGYLKQVRLTSVQEKLLKRLLDALFAKQFLDRRKEQSL